MKDKVVGIRLNNGDVKHIKCKIGPNGSLSTYIRSLIIKDLAQDMGVIYTEPFEKSKEFPVRSTTHKDRTINHDESISFSTLADNHDNSGSGSILSNG